MRLVDKFRLPDVPTLIEKPVFFVPNYIRRNKQLKRIELMGYGAESWTMNADYFKLA